MLTPDPKAKIAVVVLTMDQRETTLQCLDSLRATCGIPFQLVLWDNGSTDGTADSVREMFPEALIHYHPGNLGVAGSRNAAARLAIETFRPNYLLFLDNDITVEPGFVEALLEPLQRDPRVGQTQAKLRFMDAPERLNDGGGAQIDWVLGRVRPVGYGEVDRGQRDQMRECVSCGGAMVVRADLFVELGGFDIGFNPFGPEDLDFSLRLAKAGYKALYVPSAVAYHAVSHTFGNGYTEDYARQKVRHWFVLMRRHATNWQQLAFLLIGLPYMTARAALREGRRGNFRGIRGLARGAADLLRAPGRAEG